MTRDLLCLAKLYQLLLLFQHADELSIALSHEMQDQLTAVIPKHAGRRLGETQRLQKGQGETEKWPQVSWTYVACSSLVPLPVTAA